MCFLYHDNIIILGGSDGESSTDKIFFLNVKKNTIIESQTKLKSKRAKIVGGPLYLVHDEEFKNKNIFSN